MIVTIRVQPSKQGGKDEYVRLAEIATMSEILAELTATARHYAKVRDQHHRAIAWLSYGKVLATVGVSPDARPIDPQVYAKLPHRPEKPRIGEGVRVSRRSRTNR